MKEKGHGKIISYMIYARLEKNNRKKTRGKLVIHWTLPDISLKFISLAMELVVIFAVFSRRLVYHFFS